MLQQGKGSDLGSAFGGGSSDSLFGPLGPSNFFSKLTWGLITVFFVLCLLLAYISKQELTLNVSDDVIQRRQKMLCDIGVINGVINMLNVLEPVSRLIVEETVKSINNYKN